MALLLKRTTAGLLLFALTAPIFAAPLAEKDVPEPLKPWIEWVLFGQKDAKCPFLQGRPGQKRCLWPAKLDLVLNDKGGAFTQSWFVHGEDWVALPGDAKRWPQATTVDGAPARVILRGGLPSLYLKKGGHTVAGSFKWDSLPELLQVPHDTALLSLSVRGQGVRFPVRDDQGRLWLRKTQQVVEGESRMEIIVHRRVEDDVPLLLLTRLQLKVSGQSREVLLGKALPDGFAPMSISSPLPARIEPDGRLRVQVRPGNWQLTLAARYAGPVSAITLGEPGGPWDSDEAWVFVSRDAYRLVTVEGVPAIDPQQTELPPDWREFPAYLMRPGDTMRLVERRRGDADPSADRLALDRTFWLDFDGRGLSVQDKITGTLSRSWRLEMTPGTELGRASVGGQDQFITALEKDGPAGIEVRQKDLNVSADSRIGGGVSGVPAVSWKHDFDSVTGRIHVPPGWRLIHAWGVDDAKPSWINKWTLLDLFLVLIISLSIGKLWGWRWGLLAFATTGIAWHERMAPQWIWLLLLVGEALLRALPDGKFLRWTKIYRWLVWIGLALIAVPFFILQVRSGLYPQLENTHRMFGHGQAMFVSAAGTMSGGDEIDYDMGETAASPPLERASKAGLGHEYKRKVQAARGASQSSYGHDARIAQSNIYAPDPNSKVSTGPGLPTWSWRQISLTWRGPVRAGQRLRLLWIPPGGNLLLAFLRIALILALAFGMLGYPVPDWLRTLGSSEGWRKAVKTILPALLLFLPAVAGASQARAVNDVPPPEILSELKNRLLAPPECAPNCADSPRLRLDVTADIIEARMEINAEAETAVPLPGGGKQWEPSTVLLDGAPARGLMRYSDGGLWLVVQPGSHQVLLRGPIPDRETLQLPLPLTPHRVETSVSGWVLDGVHEDGHCDANLQLTRARGRKAAKTSTLEPGDLPPFVRVERTLRLGLSWQVETRVIRMTPPGSAIVVEVPLLLGENVTTAGIRTSADKAQVNMSPHNGMVFWHSVLKERPEIKLAAPDSVPWVEVWRLDAGPIWNAQAEGIPAVHGDGPGLRVREWRPWPGETLSILVRRPEGVPGQTLTFDSAKLRLSPGIRAADAALELSMRSNRGGQHTFTLPEGAELQMVRIDGAEQPIRQDGRKVTLPIRPGSHSAQLSWRESRGIRLSYLTPEVDLGLPSVNTNLTVSMPADRWTLFLCGPKMGPAVLFWSLLAVFLLVSIGLGKLQLTPLRAKHWFLLFMGLTQVPFLAAAVIAVWFVALGWRKTKVFEQPRDFNAIQIVLALLTFCAFSCLFSSITKGLLGMPDMQISGNGSTASMLQWYNDRSAAVLPKAWVFSVPLMLYRLAMLSWALWLASAMLGWVKWGWGCFTEGGYWKAVAPKQPKEAPEPPKPPPAPKP